MQRCISHETTPSAALNYSIHLYVYLFVLTLCQRMCVAMIECLLNIISHSCPVQTLLDFLINVMFKHYE